jgi:succinyl-CoA synthetase, beta subunit
MKIHEYQAKELFSNYGIPVERHHLCHNIDEALLSYRQLKVAKVMIKAQVLTGGRGKAGGIKLAQNVKEVSKFAKEILSMKIQGFPVDRILVSEAVNIKAEYYISFTTDRNRKATTLMLSDEGGIEIEEVAHSTPGRIHRFWIDPMTGIPDYLARRAAFTIFEDIELITQMTLIIQNLYNLYQKTDASLAEINPLALTYEGKLIAIDAKMTFDDNALYRHSAIKDLHEPTEEEKTETEANKKGFSYVHLGGDIGCMVNGAGLAMATMDIIKLYGGNPANFLDIGGSSNPEKVIEAIKLLLQDNEVKVVLINIFGGITRCDDVANGLLQAVKQISTDIPIVLRLTGTNEKEARALLKDSAFIIAQTMSEAAQVAVDISLKNT